jgi:hypothetical protein
LINKLKGRLSELTERLQDRFKTEIHRLGIDAFVQPLVYKIYVLHARVTRWEVGAFIFGFAFLFFWFSNSFDLIIDLCAAALVYFPLKSTYLLVFHAAGREFFHKSRAYRWLAFLMGFVGAVFLALLVVRILLLVPFPAWIAAWFPGSFALQPDVRATLWKTMALLVGLGSSYFLSIVLEEVDIVGLIVRSATKEEVTRTPTSGAS